MDFPLEEKPQPYWPATFLTTSPAPDSISSPWVFFSISFELSREDQGFFGPPSQAQQRMWSHCTKVSRYNTKERS